MKEILEYDINIWQENAKADTRMQTGFLTRMAEIHCINAAAGGMREESRSIRNIYVFYSWIALLRYKSFHISLHFIILNHSKLYTYYVILHHFISY